MAAYTAINQIPLNALPSTSGVIQKFISNSTNSGGSTYSPDGLAAAPIFGLGGVSLQGNEIISGGTVTLVSYVGAALNSGNVCWVLLDCTIGAQQVGAAIASSQATQAGQITSGSLVSGVAGGTANAINVAFPAGLTAYANGQPFTIISATTNTGPMTAALSLGGTTHSSIPIVKGDNQPVAPGDFPAGYPGEFRYSAAFGALVLNNPATSMTQSIGYAQSWQDVTSSRALGTVYTNNTGRPIAVSIACGAPGGSGQLLVNGVTMQYFNTALSGTISLYAVIPPGATYNTAVATTLSLWAELR